MAITIESGITIGSGIAIGTPTVRPQKTVSVVGSVITQSTANPKFGIASLFNNGALGNYLSVTPYESFAFGTGDFTIEFWVYPTNDASYECMIGFRPPNTNGPYMSVNIDYPTTDTISIYANDGLFSVAAPNAVPNNTWTSVALVCNSGMMRWYINGQQSGNATSNISWAAGSCIIACDDYSRDNGPLIGYMDELRISNIARYTSNYTPATQQFVDDANTLLLLHFDGTGQDIIDDAY